MRVLSAGKDMHNSGPSSDINEWIAYLQLRPLLSDSLSADDTACGIATGKNTPFDIEMNEVNGDSSSLYKEMLALKTRVEVVQVH